MITEVYKQIIVFIILLILSYSAAKINVIATILSVFIPIYLLFRPMKDLDISLFRAWKGPSVLIPLLIFANFYLLPKSFSKYANKNLKIVKFPKRKGDMVKVISNNSKLKKFIKWKPKFNNLDTIVRSCINWEKRQ